MRTVGRVDGSVISMLTNAYGYVCGWVYNIQMLTDAYGGYRWVDRKYLNAYGRLPGGWVCGFVKLRCLRNIWTAPKIVLISDQIDDM